MSRILYPTPHGVPRLGPEVERLLDSAEFRMSLKIGPERAKVARNRYAEKLRGTGAAVVVERAVAMKRSLDAAFDAQPQPGAAVEAVAVPAKTRRRREKKRRLAQARRGR